MKWILLIVGALALLILAVVVIGAMLPREHRASRRVRFHKTAEEIFGLISGPQDWRPDVAKWEKLPPENGRPRSRETLKSGDVMLMEIVESAPPRRHVTKIADPNLPFGGTWTWEVTPIPDGCEARVTEDGFVSNPVFRFVSRFVMGHRATMDAYLKNLGKKTGEEVTLED